MTAQEKKINKTNIRYRIERKAVIQKIEVPIIMTDTGLVPQQSTVDFVGVYTYNGIGRGIAFDAKATKKKTSFPLENIKSHQLLFLDYWESVGGLAFFLIQFENMHKNEGFITPLSLIHKYWDNADARKSIPYKDFDKAWLVDQNDYLKDYFK